MKSKGINARIVHAWGLVYVFDGGDETYFPWCLRLTEIPCLWLITYRRLLGVKGYLGSCNLLNIWKFLMLFTQPTPFVSNFKFHFAWSGGGDIACERLVNIGWNNRIKSLTLPILFALLVKLSWLENCVPIILELEVSLVQFCTFVSSWPIPYFKGV